MTDKETALCALHEFEASMKGRGLPVVILIGLPGEGDFIRAANGMESEYNRINFEHQFGDLIATYNAGGRLGKEGRP